MEQYKVNINFFGLFRLAFWVTVLLAILKLTHTIVIADWVVFLPLAIAFGIFFMMVFFIGLLCLYLIYNNSLKIPGLNDGESDDEDDEEDENKD